MPDRQEVQSAVAKSLKQQEQSYNKTARTQTYAPLKAGDWVHWQMKPAGEWQPAVVVEASSFPRSYVIQTLDGSTFRRNRRILKPTPGMAREAPIQQDGQEYSAPSEQARHSPLAPTQPCSSTRPITPPVPATGRVAAETSATTVPNTQSSAPSPKTMTTRSGRVVKPPSRYDD